MTGHDAPTIEHGVDASLGLIARTMEFPIGHYLRSIDTEDGSQLVASGLVYCEPALGGERARSGVGDAAPNEGDTDRAAFSRDVLEFDPRGLHWWKTLGVEMVCTIPVVISNRLHGVFEFFDLPGRSLAESTGNILEHLGSIVGQAVEKRLAEERVRRFAYRDDLTGLPNRQHFHQL